MDANVSPKFLLETYQIFFLYLRFAPNIVQCIGANLGYESP